MKCIFLYDSWDSNSRIHHTRLLLMYANYDFAGLEQKVSVPPSYFFQAFK